MYLKRIISFSTSIAIFFMTLLLFPIQQTTVFATQTRKQNFSFDYHLSGNAGEDIVRIAKAQIGKSGSNLDYSEEWCANFVSDCADLAGQSKAVPRTGAVSNVYTAERPWKGLEQTIQEAGGHEVSVSEAKAGDIAFFSDHVEIVSYVSNGKAYTIGGNTGNGGSLYARVVSDERYYGEAPLFILRPKYTTNHWYDNMTLTNLGNSFYAYIINSSTWKMATLNSSNNVELQTEVRDGNQIWKFVRQSNGSYVIYNGRNAEYKYVLDSTGTNTPESNVYGFEGYVDSTAQRWYIYTDGSAYYLRSECTDCTMDVAGANDADGTNIHMYTYNGTDAQKFNIYKIDDFWFKDYAACNLGDTFDAFIINTDPWKLLTRDDDNNVTIRTETGDDNQFWRFKRQPDGSYAVYNGKNGEFKFVLDSTETNTAEANVYTYMQFEGGKPQKWYIRGKENNYKLQTQITECVLDVSGGKSVDGTNVQMYTFNDSSAQNFQIYKIQLKNVKFDANGGTCSSTDKNVAYHSKYGSLPIPTRSGYSFNGWYTAKTGGTKITSDTKVEIESSQTLYAQWTASTLKVSFDANGGKVDIASVNVTSGKTYGSLPVPTKTGYTFNGWYTAKTGGTKITSDTKVAIESNQTLYAQWSVCSYNVTFDANEGTMEETILAVKYGYEFGKLPTPTRDGYTFEGWFTDKTGGTIVTATTKLESTLSQTLYAHWKAIDVSITFDANGGNVDITSKEVSYDSTYGELPTPKQAGYIFTGWFTDKVNGDVVNEETKVMITKNQVLYAHWDKINLPNSLKLYNGEQYALELPNDMFTYKSNNNDVVVISKNGVITAIEEGTSLISIIDSEFNVIQINVNVVPDLIVGDANGDSIFSVADIVLFQKWLLAVPNTKISNWKAVDMNEDNKLDVFDMVLLRRYLISQV